jgi:hypothetical protein
MSKIRKFMRSLASAGPQPINTGIPQKTGSSQAPQKEAVKKRLATLAGALKDALAQNGPNVGHMTALTAALEKHIRKNDLEQAAKVLDELRGSCSSPQRQT